MLGRATVFGVGIACLAGVSAAQVEPHRDVQLTVEDGQIQTGVVNLDDPDNPVTSGVRVFSRSLGEFGIDGFTDDPGFNAFSDTFVPGTPIGFDIMDHLRRWDADEEHFDEIPSETMSLSLGATVVETPSAGESPSFPVPGFFFASASSTGGIHQHVNFFLNTPQTPGVYLLQLRVVTGGSVAPSEPVYIIFSQEAETPEVESAEAYVEALVNGPELCVGDCDGSGDGRLQRSGRDAVRVRAGRGEACDSDGSGTIDFSTIWSRRCSNSGPANNEHHIRTIKPSPIDDGEGFFVLMTCVRRVYRQRRLRMRPAKPIHARPAAPGRGWTGPRR